MPKVPVIEEYDGGWSDWIYPTKKFREICCSCGLSHDVEYKITDDGWIAFRLKQNDRATAAVRRRRGRKPKTR